MIASVICISLFLFLIVRDNQRSQVLSHFSLGLLLFAKVIGAFGFYALYTYYYGNGTLSEDAGSFIQEGKMINELLSDRPKDYWTILFNLDGHETVIQEVFAQYNYSRFAHPEEWINSTRNGIKLIAVLLLISGGWMPFVFIFFTSISIGSIYLFWKTIHTRFTPFPILIFLFILPSLLLWNSSILREVLGMSGLLIGLSGYFHHQKKLKWLFIGLGWLLLLSFKPIWLVLVLLSLGVVLIKKALFSKTTLWIASSIALLFLFVFSGLPNKLLKKTSDKQFDFINVAKGGVYLHDQAQTYRFELSDTSYLEQRKGHWTLTKSLEAEAINMGKEGAFIDTILPMGKSDLTLIFQFSRPSSEFELLRINNRWSNLFKLIPAAFTNVWLRPYPWENQSTILNVGMTVENVFLLTIFLWALWKIVKRKTISDFELFALFFIVLTTLAIGWVTPVTGAIVRYRIPIQMMIVIMYIANKPKEYTWLKNMFS